MHTMRIERDIINQFKVWKEAPERKPILLKGARQIGKTWVERWLSYRTISDLLSIRHPCPTVYEPVTYRLFLVYTYCHLSFVT